MSVREEVREAQRRQFEKEGLDPSLGDSTYALYDQLDALTPDQRSLVVDNALALVQNIGAELITTTDDNQRLLLHTSLHALVAVAGYCNNVAREDAGWTSVSDTKVNAALDAIRNLIRETVTAQMPEDMQQMVAAVSEPIKQRVAAGEPYEEVAADEVAKYRREHPKPDDANVVPGEVVTTKADEPEQFGFYL